MGCAVAGCTSASLPLAGAQPADMLDPIRNADFRARYPIAPRQSNRTDQSGRPLIFPGSEGTPSPTPGSLEVNGSVRRVADAGATSGPGGVEFNFDSADIPTVAKSLLGDVLELSYSVDPRVQGTVTLASAAPVARKDVLPVLESVLRMSNAAIVREGNLAKIVPLQDAGGSGNVSVGMGQPGFGVSVVPLRYTSAATIAR